MSIRSYTSEGIVLKRVSVGEADRIVTIFTKRFGKIVAIAKGVRKITSRRSGSLEPGTCAVFQFTKGKSLDIITQVKLINSYSHTKTSLPKVTQIHQVLEITDLLIRENQQHSQAYETILQTLNQLNSNGSKRTTIVQNIGSFLKQLGFGIPEDSSELGIKKYIEEITERKLRSKAMLLA